MLSRRATILVAVVLGASLTAGASASAASSSGLGLFLPGAGFAPGWSIVSAAERDAVDEKGLYDMYDGAVPDMQKRGVCYAHQRTFRNGKGKSITVDIYTLYTWQHAKAYYGLEKSGIRSLPKFTTWPLKAEACAAQAAGTTTCFLWSRNYAASISVQGAGSDDLTTAKSVATAISGKIKAYYSK
jgi:hypothetical protein